MLIEFPIRLLLSQALVEYGVLSSLAAGVANARYRLEMYTGKDSAVYILGALVLIVIFLRLRRRH